MEGKIGEKVFEVLDAANWLRNLKMRVGEFPEALQPPFEINFPFAVAAESATDCIEIKGGYQAISALQRMVN